jgi:hypothetical protein
MEDFRFDVTHLALLAESGGPSGFADRPGPEVSTGDPDLESEQELFSRLGCDAPCSAVLATIRAGWASNRRAAAATFAKVQEGIQIETKSMFRRETQSPPPGPG